MSKLCNGIRRLPIPTEGQTQVHSGTTVDELRTRTSIHRSSTVDAVATFDRTATRRCLMSNVDLIEIGELFGIRIDESHRAARAGGLR
jgi:hypothetical protein